MKIMLISPLPVLRQRPKPAWMPLNLAFMAGLLIQQGHSVIIYDRYARAARVGLNRHSVDKDMVATLDRFGPDLIGLSTVSPLIYDTIESVSLIRKRYSGILLAGGHHATALPSLTLKRIPGLDGVIAGEGEKPLAALASGAAPQSIAGVWWKAADGTVRHRDPQQIANLDELPFPALDRMDMPFYTRPGFTTFRGRYMSSACLLTARGCDRKCTFCAESLTYGPRIRTHSNGYILDWIQKVLCDYQVNGIYFLDNNFLYDRSRAAGICEAIIAQRLHRQFRWAIQARADCMDAPLLKLLKRAGCDLIEIGVESPRQHHLDAIRKATDTETNRRAIKLCQETGIGVHAYMLTGLPGETLSDLEAALKWIRTVRPRGFGWADLKAYPGTRLYTSSGKGFFEKQSWDRESVTAHYRERHFSPLEETPFDNWLRRHYTPYHTWRRCLAALRLNPIRTLVAYALADKRSVLELAKWLMWRIVPGPSRN